MAIPVPIVSGDRAFGSPARQRTLRFRAHGHLEAPKPPAGSFDAMSAERGRALFDRACATCHVGGSGTDNNDGKLHAPTETGVDGAYAVRTVNKAYRPTPLRALWQHPPYFHDGSAATLGDVVAHYNRVRTLGLTPQQQRELVRISEIAVIRIPRSTVRV